MKKVKYENNYFNCLTLFYLNSNLAEWWSDFLAGGWIIRTNHSKDERLFQFLATSVMFVIPHGVLSMISANN
jgi:hypothetical protein